MRYGLCPGRDSKGAPPEYESRASLLRHLALHYVYTFIQNRTHVKRTKVKTPVMWRRTVCTWKWPLSDHCFLALFLLTPLQLLVPSSIIFLITLPLENSPFKGRILLTLFSLFLLVRAEPRFQIIAPLYEYHFSQSSAYSSTLKMEAGISSETLITIYHTTWRHNPESSNPHGYTAF
jgi:hypothetical protein